MVSWDLALYVSGTAHLLLFQFIVEYIGRSQVGGRTYGSSSVFAISICPMQDPDTIISDRQIHSRRVEAQARGLHAELAVVRTAESS